MTNCCVVHHYFDVNGSLRPYVLPGRLILLPVIVSIALVGFLLHLYCCIFLFFFYIFAWLRSTVLHLIKLVESTMIAYLISYGIAIRKPNTAFIRHRITLLLKQALWIGIHCCQRSAWYSQIELLWALYGNIADQTYTVSCRTLTTMDTNSKSLF
jgi:hypothetical protein